MASETACDLAIVGGGLAGGLIALALVEARPELRLLVIDGGDVLGGNHIWSFFASDVAEADRALVMPLVDQTWDGYDIAFPDHRRTIATPYQSIRSESLDAAVRAALPPDAIRTGCAVAAVAPDAVTLADGARIAAHGVIDARGPGDIATLDVGWQKFVGRELRLRGPHGLKRPMVMDATVEQIDGYRFVYLLPFGRERLFVEDTYYSDTPEIDVAACGSRIEDYVAARGWRLAEILREERGALPVLLGGDFEAYWRSSGAGVAKAGTRAGLFHPTTGYSLPDAVRTARLVAQLDDLSGAALHRALHRQAARAWKSRGFYRLLDRMLFIAAKPEERWKVLERFYRLDAGLIERFYAARSTLFDKARVLVGKPPLPISRGLKVVFER